MTAPDNSPLPQGGDGYELDRSPLDPADREPVGPIFNGPISESLLRDLGPALLGAGAAGISMATASVLKERIAQRGKTERERLRQDGMTRRVELGQPGVEGLSAGHETADHDDD